MMNLYAPNKVKLVGINKMSMSNCIENLPYQEVLIKM